MRSATACWRCPAIPSNGRSGGPDFDALAPTAVEEIVRWASPVVYMRRTLTQDVELSGTKMAAGDKVIAVVQLGQPRRVKVRQSVGL